MFEIISGRIEIKTEVFENFSKVNNGGGGGGLSGWLFITVKHVFYKSNGHENGYSVITNIESIKIDQRVRKISDNIIQTNST